MTNKEFNKHLKELSGKSGLLDKAKMRAADNALRNQLINHLVRHRHNIVEELINDETDRSWLASMGYMYRGTNGKFNFLCTCESYIHQHLKPLP